MVCLRDLLLPWLCAASAAGRIFSGGGSMIGGNAAVYTAAASAVAIIASSPAAVATEVATSAASSEWNSSPFKLRSIAENSLGLLARNCAVTYCGVGVSGLDLWVRFQQVQ